MSDNEFAPSGPSTRAVHAGEPEARAGRPVVNPIHQSTTFFSHPDGEGEVLYTRYGNNPNHQLLEQRVCALERAEAAVVLGSGMAALTCAVLSLARAGDHVVASGALYGGTRTLLDRELPRLGIEASYVDLASPEWTDALRANTRVLLFEVPTNPLLRVYDVAAIAAAAHDRGVAVVVDSTFATPINFRPLEHGVDLVMHSATKYLGGHSDVTAGVVCGSAERVASVRARAVVFGPALDPHAAWLLERGIKTLAVRMQRHNENGLTVARWCVERPEIARVHYPGLPDHPDHARAARLLDGFGGMVSLELHGGDTAVSQVVRALRMAKYAPSLGGVETLVSEPRHTSHAAMSVEERAAVDIGPGFLRLSLGIEDASDIIADLEQALSTLG